MITYEATYCVQVTVDDAAKLAEVEKALEETARKFGTDVNVNDDDVVENDDSK